MTGQRPAKRGREALGPPLLEIQHLTVDYDGNPAVRDVTLEAAPGEVLGIVGESGSGKTTLLKAAVGALGAEARIREGSVRYQGRPIAEMSGEELRALRGKEIGMVFQNCRDSFCPVRTIEAQVYEFVSQHERAGRKEVRERAAALLAKLHFKDAVRALKSYPFELSGGMNQRMGIMMAMLLGPKLLLADEPTAALDVTSQAQVLEEMRKLQEESGTAILLVTHNLSVLSRLSGRVLIMNRGQIVEQGNTREVLRNPSAEYTRSLLKAVPKLRL